LMITPHGSMGKFQVFRNGTLLIQNANVKDRGQYLCLAENDYGSDKLLIMLSVVAYPSRILEPGVRDIKVYSGKTVEMRCKAEGRPVPVVSWILANRTQVMGQDNGRGRVTVTPEGTLVIRQVSVYDRGRYKCVASNAAGVDSVTMRLQVVAAPPNILEEKRQLLRANTGQGVWMPCTAQGDPQPTSHWVLFGGTVVRPPKTDSKVSVFPNGTLHMKNLDVSDSGKYECIATSSTGSERRVVTLSVKKIETAPQIVETSDWRTELEYGGNLHLNYCKASGAPIPEISWGLPDGTLVNSALQADSSRGGRAKRYTLFDNGTLYLNEVGMDEEGDYTCYAENTLGKDEMHVHITVVSAPPQIRPPSRTYAKVKPGANIRFDCEAAGEPKPKILWRLPSNDMIAASNERYLMHVNGSLDVRDVKLADAGEYVCMARNAAGDESKVYKLDIDGNPPVINGYYQNRTVLKDTAAKYSRKMIDCKAEGKPPPKITNMKENKKACECLQVQCTSGSCRGNRDL
uniref:Ig-like domain-containing protein n=1 Tax=Electrophorus electricus TaxID=8005 RepID=A0A4W4HNK0_ELEEL